MHKVKVINEQESLLPTHIYIDDAEIHGVKHLEYFKAGVDELPLFKFEVSAMPEVIEIGQADVRFQFTPQTTQEATEVLKHALSTDIDFYNDFLASILSALRILPKDSNIEDAAKAVADRIIGEE